MANDGIHYINFDFVHILIDMH